MPAARRIKDLEAECGRNTRRAVGERMPLDPMNPDTRFTGDLSRTC